MTVTTFISYARADDMVLEAVSTHLERAGLDVIVDRDALRPGEDWRQRLKQMITHADVFVFLVSNSSLTSQYCTWEVQTALDLGKRILPVILEDVISEAIPEKIRALNYLFMRTRAERYENLEVLAYNVRHNPDWVRYQTSLTVRAAEWTEGGSLSDELLLGAPLQQAQNFIIAPPADAPPPSELVRHYVLASLAEAQRKKDEELRDAQDRAATERGLRRAADARRISAEARLLATSRPDLAALLVLEAWRMDQSETTRDALLGIALKWRRLQSFAIGTSSAPPTGATRANFNRISFSDDLRLCLIAAGPKEQSVRLFEAGNPDTPLRSFETPYPIVATALDAARGLILLLEGNGTLWLVPADGGPDKSTAVRVETEAQDLDCNAMIRCGATEVAIASGANIILYDYIAQDIRWRTTLNSVRAVQRLDLHGPNRIMALGFPVDRRAKFDARRSVSFNLKDGGNEVPYGSAARSMNNGDAVVLKAETGELIVAPENDLIQTSEVKAPDLKQRPWDFSANATQLAYGHNKTVDFALKLKSGGFGQVNFRNSTQPQPVHNGYVGQVKGLPPGFGVGFASFGKDGSAAFWSEKPNAVLVHRSKELTSGGSPAFSQDGKTLCSFSKKGYVLRSTADWEPFARGHESLQGFSDFGGRAIGILAEGAAIWLDTKEHIMAFPPVASLKAQGAQVFAAREDGTLCYIDLKTQMCRDIDKVELPKRCQQWIEIDADRRRVGYKTSDYALTIRDLETGNVREITTEKGFDIGTFKFLRESGHIAISSGERTKVFDRDTVAIRYDYGTGSSYGTPMFADTLAVYGMLVMLEDLGGRLSFVDHHFRSVQAQLRAPTGDHIYQMVPSPTEPLLLLLGNAGIAILDLRPEVLVRRLETIAGRDLTSEERDQFGLSDERL